MKVLLGLNRLFEMPGGTETFFKALVTEFHNCGHDVTSITALQPHGTIFEQIKDTFKPLESEYDLIFFQHPTTYEKISHIKGLKVNMVHGIYHELEKPVPGMNYYVSASKEIQEWMFKEYNIDSRLIHAGVDMNEYRIINSLNLTLKNILAIPHSNNAENFYRKIFSGTEYNLTIRNKFKNHSHDMAELINQNDLVISLGRGAIEAMSCGRNVYVYDQRRYQPGYSDGIINMLNIGQSMNHNFSGRFSKNQLSESGFLEELNNYDYTQSIALRDYMLQNYDIKNTVKEIEGLVL